MKRFKLVNGCTPQRDRAIQQAKTNITKAYKLANSIPEYWFRTQALAWVAWYANDSDFTSIIQTSIRSAFANEDPFQVVGSSAWVIGAIIERGRYQEIRINLQKILEISSTIQNPVNRADALFLLWQAVFPLGKSAYQEILEKLIQACKIMKSWKKPLILRDVVLILAKEDVKAASLILNEMEAGRIKRQTQKLLAAEEVLLPRSFFWRT